MDIYINYIKDHVLLQSLVLVSISYVIFIMAKNLLLKSLKQIFKRTSTQVDDQLVAQGFFTRLSYLIPLAIIHNFAHQLAPYELWISRGTLAGMTVAILLAINALLNSINEIYSQSKYAKKINIKSYFQILKLIVNILGTIIVIAILSGRSPIYLLSGIGALTAVLMLVFKDTILSFVASIQINSNNLFKIGDWLEIPQLGADGDVIDIALHTVKIQNWDKTISIIPTHKLIDSSFKNWRGMSESGGRRIKRSIYIDQNSIKFCSPEELEHFKTFELLTEYLNDKISELDVSNSERNINMDAGVNGRRITNIGTFRAYIQTYLKNHSKTLLIKRREDKRLRAYGHIGTGNFHEGTANTYTDLSLFTSSPVICRDIERVFQFLTKSYVAPKLSELVMSPLMTRQRFMDEIDQEIEAAARGNGFIALKLNNLEDPEIIEKLYEASQAGVKARMIVRGMCCLRPGVAGLSENIKVRSIVDRYLEHARLMIFGRGDRQRIYISSADWMTRNFDYRVEVTTPILDSKIGSQIEALFETQWSDTTKARVIDQDQSNRYHPRGNKRKIRSQVEIRRVIETWV